MTICGDTSHLKMCFLPRTQCDGTHAVQIKGLKCSSFIPFLGICLIYINISKVTGVKQQYYTTFSEAHSAIDIVIGILEHEKQTTDVEFNKSLDIQKLAQNSRKQKINDVFQKKKKSKNRYVCSLNIKQN